MIFFNPALLDEFNRKLEQEEFVIIQPDRIFPPDKQSLVQPV